MFNGFRSRVMKRVGRYLNFKKENVSFRFEMKKVEKLMVITLGNFGGEGETFFFFNLTMPGLSCSMRDLAPRPGIETRPPELEVQSLNH